MKRSMCQLINLFVDGEITTSDQAWKMLLEETDGDGCAATELATAISKTAERLCPRTQANMIDDFFTDHGGDI